MGEKPGVAIVIDGVPVFERTGRVNIDLDNIESIKVIKGGASYLFGEDALSGAVIITTKRGAKMAGFTASAEAGSFGYRKGLARAGFAKGNWVGHVQATKRQTDGYHDQGDSFAEYLDGKLQYLVDETSDIAFGFEQSRREKAGVAAAGRNARQKPARQPRVADALDALWRGAGADCDRNQAHPAGGLMDAAERQQTQSA